MSTTYILNEKIKSRTDRNQFKNRLAEILGDSANPAVLSAFSGKVSKQIKMLSNQENFVFGLIKGETHRLIDIDKFFADSKIHINKRQKSEIHNLVQLLLADEMNEYRTFSYVSQNFPLMSFLKRELLETRQGGNIPQWKFIAESCPHLRKEFYEYFEKIANYKEISDDICGRAVSSLVKYATGIRFDNTMSQSGKGWYPNGYFSLPEQLHNIKPYPLFLIACSFRLTLAKYDEMHAKNEDIYDCMSYEDNMFRFALVYIREKAEIKEFMKILDENRIHFFRKMNISPDIKQVSDNIKSFFKNKGSMKRLVFPFMELLEKSGVVSAAVREKFLESERCKIAQKNMKELIADVQLDPIIRYYSLLNGTADNIIRFKYKDDMQNAEKAIAVIHENYRRLAECCRPYEKKKILSIICDSTAPDSSKKFIPSVRLILKNKFTTTYIRKLSSGIPAKLVTRNDILKIAYLRTFIDFVNKNDLRFRNKKEMTESAKALTKNFEETANKMLEKCFFAPVHITFPLDGLIYISLSGGISDKCIPEVFQSCLPIKLND